MPPRLTLASVTASTAIAHTTNSNPLRRRLLGAALVGVPALWLGARAQPAPVRRLTPAQTEGPFYPAEFPKDADHDLLRNGKLTYPAGQPTWLARMWSLAGAIFSRLALC